LGSNLFNLLILFVGDVALRQELLFEHTGSSHGLSFLFILTLSLMALGLLRTTQPKKAQLLGSVMVLTYLISLLIQS
jgi:Ca2+/Na+ antiporter